MPALLMGACAGVICFLACSKIKHALKYDDALDAFGVHGIGGMVGAVLTGVFATRACWDVTENGTAIGLLESGDPSLVIGQVVAVLITFVFAIVGSFILLKIIDLAIGLRVPSNEEQRGLDQSDHGEEGYMFA
jgi:Amt family ammonium transporter